MFKKCLRGGLIGGVILFFWGALSWMVLPWHRSVLNSFDQEIPVETILKLNAPRAGVYLLPNTRRIQPGMAKKDQEKFAKRMREKMERGLFAFVVLRPDGMGPMMRQMIFNLFANILAAFLVTWLTAKTRLSGVGRLGFILGFALASWATVWLPEMIWWGFPKHFVLVELADLLIGWFFAGIAISQLTRDYK